MKQKQKQVGEGEGKDERKGKGREADCSTTPVSGDRNAVPSPLASSGHSEFRRDFAVGVICYCKYRISNIKYVVVVCVVLIFRHGHVTGGLSVQIAAIHETGVSRRRLDVRAPIGVWSARIAHGAHIVDAG